MSARSMNFPVIPTQASDFAGDVDHIFWVLVLLSVFFTTLVMVLLTVFAVRFRRGARVDRSNPSLGDLRLELAWSIGPLVLGCMVFAWSAKPFSSVYAPPADATEIFVIGKQWMWHIQHANGIRENNELHIPVGRAVKLTVISQDVIHGFYVPAFRVKRDVLPGRYNTVWFTPTEPGKYYLFCSEYCGTNHSEMTGFVYVMEPSDYQRWEANSGSRAVAERTTPEQQGENLYETLACGSCHAERDSPRGPTLYGLYGNQVKLANGQTVTVDDNYIRTAIVNPHSQLVAGYPDIMQGYETGSAPGQLSEEQFLSLVAYIRSLGNTPTTTAAGATVSAGSAKRTRR